MDDLLTYIYIDRNGIDSLFAQAYKELVTEQNVQTANRFQANVEAQVGLPELLKNIFKLDVNGSTEYEKSKSINKISTYTHEQRISELIIYLEAKNQLIRSLGEIYKSRDESIGIFIYCNLLFDTDFDYNNWFEAIASAIKEGHISFYTRNDKYPKKYVETYDGSDNYYKKRKSRLSIFMDMGVQNMVSFGGITSHLALLLRVTKGENIPLGVFGRIFKVADDCLQIKPYAVWRV